jgi:hypothetical protein
MARYMIDWQTSGSWEIEAKDADEAQAKFDKAWEAGRIKPDRDGETTNETPYIRQSN